MPALDPATSPTALPLFDRCPRCGGGFHCGANDAGPCACTALTLADSTLAALRQRYDSCLCLRCLQAVAGGADIEPLPGA
ncbi:MAG TPA: cysteine-rich CWC family protein [Ideonella sp.]|uniref:cysteine-rich CWC family protein n=1 Tax=Ideonella sp. TaxID=1929293 RepID=UPI002BFD1425|nr:cysteine-rich CWC family protein [Ideonella sp.]HSI49324.1 cysteine-rich CWC family protein [Ideonella sp.]